jgi:hypothetical protein
MEESRLEELIVIKSIKQFPAFCRFRVFVVDFKKPTFGPLLEPEESAHILINYTSRSILILLCVEVTTNAGLDWSTDLFNIHES